MAGQLRSHVWLVTLVSYHSWRGRYSKIICMQGTIRHTCFGLYQYDAACAPSLSWRAETKYKEDLSLALSIPLLYQNAQYTGTALV